MERENLPAQRTEPSRMPARMGEFPMSRLRGELDALFDRFFGRWPMPFEFNWGSDRFWDVDVEETDKEIQVWAEAPGFEPKDFDIHIGGDMLTIRAEHKQGADQQEGEYHFRERRFGRFQRSVRLPAAVDAEKVEADYRNGVLELRIPRSQEAQRQRIEVKG